ncbi:hypothetical protein DITRI_Ditri03aG0224800 [Diplodiscus trichospermus]
MHGKQNQYNPIQGLVRNLLCVMGLIGARIGLSNKQPYLLAARSRARLSLAPFRALVVVGATMQGGSSGIGYGLKQDALCISDVKADTDHTSLITGTLSLREENEVHLIRLSSGGTELICEGLFSYPNEIWDLASCPFDQRIFSTVFSTAFSNHLLQWSLAIALSCIKFGGLKKDAQVQSKESAGMLHYLSGGAWDPHGVNAVATTCESSVQFWDLRTMKKSNAIEHAHIRNANYDAKKNHILVTAEDESGTHIWDLRKPKIPVKELPGHTHCIAEPPTQRADPLIPTMIMKTVYMASHENIESMRLSYTDLQTGKRQALDKNTTTSASKMQGALPCHQMVRPLTHGEKASGGKGVGGPP